MMQKFGRLDNKRKKIQSNLSQASLDVASSVGSSDNEEESDGNELNRMQMMMPNKESAKKLKPNDKNAL